MYRRQLQWIGQNTSSLQSHSRCEALSSYEYEWVLFSLCSGSSLKLFYFNKVWGTRIFWLSIYSFTEFTWLPISYDDFGSSQQFVKKTQLKIKIPFPPGTKAIILSDHPSSQPKVWGKVRSLQPSGRLNGHGGLRSLVGGCSKVLGQPLRRLASEVPSNNNI